VAIPQQPLAEGAWPLCEELYGSIWAVAHPARQAEAQRLLARADPIEHSLHPSTDVQMNLYEFFHGRSRELGAMRCQYSTIARGVTRDVRVTAGRSPTVSRVFSTSTVS
jgi:hypothetical protein